MVQEPIPTTGQRAFVAEGRIAPRNFTRILMAIVDFWQKVTIDFDQRQIVFEDVMLPNKFLTLWPAPQVTVGFDEITKLKDAECEGTHVFEVTTRRGHASLIHHRYEEISEMRKLISLIFQHYKVN